jgi:hypothetical protein
MAVSAGVNARNEKHADKQRGGQASCISHGVGGSGGWRRQIGVPVTLSEPLFCGFGIASQIRLVADCQGQWKSNLRLTGSRGGEACRVVAI